MYSSESNHYFRSANSLNYTSAKSNVLYRSYNYSVLTLAAVTAAQNYGWNTSNSFYFNENAFYFSTYSNCSYYSKYCVSSCYRCGRYYATSTCLPSNVECAWRPGRGRRGRPLRGSRVHLSKTKTHRIIHVSILYPCRESSS